VVVVESEKECVYASGTLEREREERRERERIRRCSGLDDRSEWVWWWWWWNQVVDARGYSEGGALDAGTE